MQNWLGFSLNFPAQDNLSRILFLHTLMEHQWISVMIDQVSLIDGNILA